MKAIRVINSVSLALTYVATGLLVLMMLLTVADVFLRFAFNHPIKGTSEFTMLMMVCLGIGVAWCAVQDRHIKVDLVVSRLSARTQAIFDSFGLLVGLGIFAIIAWRGYLESFHIAEYGTEALRRLGVAGYPFHCYLFILGLVMLSLVMLARLIQKVAEVVKK